jgi:transcriptional regulator with XRE-family HTH domain
MLSNLLKEKCQKLELSSRQAAEKVGVSHATILRALRGDIVDLETVLKISEWLGVKPHTLLNSMVNTKAGLSEKIAIMLEDNPLLAKEFSKAVDAILKGKVETSVIEDIASYAAYQINMKIGRK